MRTLDCRPDGENVIRSRALRNAERPDCVGTGLVPVEVYESGTAPAGLTSAGVPATPVRQEPEPGRAITSLGKSGGRNEGRGTSSEPFLACVVDESPGLRDDAA